MKNLDTINTSKRLYYIENPFYGNDVFNMIINFYAAELSLIRGGVTLCLRKEHQPKRWRYVMKSHMYNTDSHIERLPNCIEGDHEKNTAKGYIMCIVRNPFDTIVRMWTFMGGEKEMSFEDFVDMFCNAKIFKSKTIFPLMMMKEFLFGQIFDRHGKCKAKIILRHEYLDKALEKFLDAYGVSKIARYKPRATLLEEVDYKKYYTPKLRRMVQKKCSLELNGFGYTFDGPVNNHAFVDTPNIIYNPITKEGKLVTKK